MEIKAMVPHQHVENLLNYCLYSTWVPVNDLWQKCEVLLVIIGWKN